MIPEIREKFNVQFDQKTYNAFLEDIHRSNSDSLVFRVAETPLFLSNELRDQLIDAAYDVAKVVQRGDFAEKCKNAVPAGMSVANEDAHTTFLQVDFAICRDENGGFIPQLIELQGFPSLYTFQHYVDQKIREYFYTPDGFTPFFSGLDSDAYRKTFGKVLLGDSDPENVVLMELQPRKQKTLIDFLLTDAYYGITPVCVTEVFQRGNKLFYKKDGRKIPVERIYYRFIFDELIRKKARPGFDLNADLDVTWVGHPNWFFKISKHTLPLIDSPFCPKCYYLNELNEYPSDLENYVLKPLYSFAGIGVQIDVTREMLDVIPDRENYILQKKIEYTPLLQTPDGLSRAEVRMMFVWDDEPMLVNNLLRLSKGKMMGVDYNKNKTWVGSSLAYHLP